jgi:alpha-N-arabinofuranosidase
MRDWARKIGALFWLVVLFLLPEGYEADSKAASISIDVSSSTSRRIPDTLFGIFFEEINHAGVGGLWGELVMNRGFEAGGEHSPSEINPWEIIGDDDSISVKTDLSSSFTSNKVALRMDILCDQDSCPGGGVGVYNPGFGGMVIN